MQLSVSDLLNFYRCSRLLFLNKYGDKSLKVPPGDFLRRLWKVGRGYEQTVIDFFKYEKPKYKIGDHDEGFNATLELMKKGTETIYQGVLKNDELTGVPDFLIKQKGVSVFGDYYYYSVDIKGASTSRERYLFQLAAYSYLLGDIQGFTPLYGGLLLLDLDLQIRYFYELMKDLVHAINFSKKILNEPENMPDLFIDSNCQMCQWYSFCLPEANKKKDLSLVPHISRKIKEDLQKIAVKNYNELAKCTEENLSQIEDLRSEKARLIILQAKAIDNNKFYIKAVPELKESKKEIFIDFESDLIIDEKGIDISKIDYLIGLLKVEDSETTFSYLLLEESEEKLASDFANFLNEHLDFTFYHYGFYEQSIFTNKWSTLPQVQLVNIEKIAKDSVIMPVTGYSLKNIARALGYRWKDKTASATQSMCWYSSYLETKDKRFIDLSIQYNKDDCYALMLVKNWLASLKEKQLPVGELIQI